MYRDELPWWRRWLWDALCWGKLSENRFGCKVIGHHTCSIPFDGYEELRCDRCRKLLRFK